MRRMPTKKEIENISKVTPETIIDNLEGDIGISVDLAEDEESAVVSLDLTGGSAGDVLKIDEAGTGVEWKPAGGKVYLHRIHIQRGPGAGVPSIYDFYINLYKSTNTPITALADILPTGLYVPAFGTYWDSGNVAYTCLDASWAPIAGGQISLRAIKNTDGTITQLSVTEGTVTDTVTEI